MQGSVMNEVDDTQTREGNVADEERERQVAEGMRRTTSDHALVRLDEKEVKERMIHAFAQFIHMGFEVHLIGVSTRKAIEYSLLLAEDGAEEISVRDIQKVADDLRLDMFVQKGLGLVLYARW